jgi:hypothetical protein
MDKTVYVKNINDKIVLVFKLVKDKHLVKIKENNEVIILDYELRNELIDLLMSVEPVSKLYENYYNKER